MQQLTELIRTIPDFPKKGILFRDITTLLKDPKGYHDAVAALADSLSGLDVDLVIARRRAALSSAARWPTPLARGWCWRESPASCRPKRSGINTTWNMVPIALKSSGRILPGQRVAIVDDLLATGGTAVAACELVKQLGGEVVALRFLIELDDLKGREALAGYDVQTLIITKEEPDMHVRTRFAPSPTGYLHIGGLRTALYTYLFTKQHHGAFILRIEDTDQERFVPGATEAIYSGMRKAGLLWDEGPDVGGDYGPYIQSQRKDLYLPYAQQLVESGHAYYCFCTKEELDARRAACEAAGGTWKYDKHCKDMPKEEVRRRLAAAKNMSSDRTCPGRLRLL